MAKIRITQGVYGHRVPARPGKKKPVRVQAVAKGEQIDVPDEEALRLVKLGVAEIISGGPTAPPVAPQSGPDPDQLPQDITEEEMPAEAAAGGEDGPPNSLSISALERMLKADLEQMAQDMGIDISGAKNNRERAELIAAAEEGYEELPELEEGDIVQ